MIRSSIIAGVLLPLTACLMDNNYSCAGGAMRKGPDNLCECPEGTALRGSRCIEESDFDSGIAPNDQDGDMPEDDRHTCDECTPGGEAGPEDADVSVETGTDGGSGQESGQDPVPPSIRQVSAGGAHTCALESAGTVRCWGKNTFGQLGDGTQTASSTPVAVTGVSDAVEIAAGGDHTCARLASGAVACWGANAGGQLGDGTTASRTSVKPVKELSDAITLSAGGDWTCSISAMDKIFCWGHGETAEPKHQYFPTNNYLEVEPGINHVCARFGNSVVCWGDMGSRGLEPPGIIINSVVELAAGDDHTCVRVSSGAVHCWGANQSGQLGAGTFDERTIAVIVAGLADAVEIDAGNNHTCARRTSGAVNCWGSNLDGQLGNGRNSTPSSPVLVSELSEPIAITAGGNHSCALLSSGTITCWGANEYGQLGDGTKVSRNAPVSVAWP